MGQSMFDLDMNVALILLFSFFVLALSLGVIWAKDLLVVILFSSMISFNMTIIYALLLAPDVAMTEAAVGACLTTLVFLASISHIGKGLETKNSYDITGITLIAIAGFLLIYIAQDLPSFGETTNPIHQGVVNYYNHNTGKDIGIPSIVAAVLASYRGFDTLGETTVIFTAALGALALLGKRKTNAR
jgi:multicomponent Na+:H+ antiporter subunit B